MITIDHKMKTDHLYSGYIYIYIYIAYLPALVAPFFVQIFTVIL